MLTLRVVYSEPYDAWVYLVSTLRAARGITILCCRAATLRPPEFWWRGGAPWGSAFDCPQSTLGSPFDLNFDYHTPFSRACGAKQRQNKDALITSLRRSFICTPERRYCIVHPQHATSVQVPILSIPGSNLPLAQTHVFSREQGDLGQLGQLRWNRDVAVCSKL